MLKFIIAFIVCKFTVFALRLLGRRASHTPGRIALHICPNYLQYIAKPKKLMCVTGTNGKSTVCNLLECALRAHGETVLDNHFGSNTENGVVTALTNGVTLFNKSTFDTCVMEVDERSSLRVYKHLTPDYLIIVDLFRDSVKRNANPDFISDIINSSVPKKTKLILNCDDILCSSLCKDNERIYFNVSAMPGEKNDPQNIINDARCCPVCGKESEFSFRRYHHIGRFHCPNCGLTAPEPDNSAVAMDIENRILTVNQSGKLYNYPLVHTGIFNVFNEMAVISMLLECGLTPAEIADSLKDIKITDSRFYENTIGDIHLICNVLKGQNPIAGSVVSNYTRSIPGDKTVFLMLDDINDIRDSSENITWYYECDFENFNDPSFKHFYIEGLRAEDMKYRLLLAGVPEQKITTFIGYDRITEIADFSLSPTFIMLFELYYYDEQLKVRKSIEEKLEQIAGGKR